MILWFSKESWNFIFKDDVAEVRQGIECGIAVRGYNDVKAGDKIEAYDIKEIARTL